MDTNERTKNRPLDWVRECLNKNVSGLVVRANVSQVDIVTPDNFRHPMEVESMSSSKMAQLG